MSLFTNKEIHLQSCITPDEFKRRLAMLVDPGTPEGITPEFNGAIKEDGFDLKYLLQPSYVKGEIVQKEYGSDINISVSLARRYDWMIIFGYLFFAFAVFLISFNLIGSVRFHRPITATGILSSILWFTPSAVAYYACKGLLNQATKFNKIVFETLLKC